MPENLTYAVSLDSSNYTRSMADCVAEVKKLGKASNEVPKDIWDGVDERFKKSRASLEDFKKSLGIVPKQLDDVTVAANKSAGALKGISNIAIGTVISGLKPGIEKAQEAVESFSASLEGSSPKMAAALGGVSSALQVVQDGADAAAGAMAFGPVVAVGVGLVTAAYKGVMRVTEELTQATEDLTDSYAFSAKSRQDQIARLAALEEQRVAGENALLQEQHDKRLADKDLREKLAAKNAEVERKASEEIAAAAEASAERVAAARERAYAVALSPQADLQRQITEQKAAGPTGQAAVDAATGEAKEGIYLRTVLIYELEKKLSDLKAADAKTGADAVQKAQQIAAATAETAAAAERKAAADAKAAAAAAKEFKGDNAILLARSMGNEKQARALEREAAVEQTKRRLIDQGAGPEAAADQAERRQKLQEMVEDRQKNPRRIRTLTPAQSAARRALSPAMRGTTEKLRRQAEGAAAAHHAAPVGGAKDHGGEISKKLETLQLILKKLENLGTA